MSMKASALAAWAESAFASGWVYWYGTCGYPCTEELLTRKARQYPEQYSENRMAKYRRHIQEGKTCTDCIGLFKACAWDTDGDIATCERTYASNGHPDCGARTALKQCSVHGDIATIPEIPGLAVWTKTGGHIGVYVGGGYVIEARGFAYGVQRNKLSERAFVTWGLYPYVEYSAVQVALAEAAAKGKTPSEDASADAAQESESPAAQSTVYPMTTLRKGSKGTQVKVLQWLLNQQGHTSGEVDGIFGTNTLAAVKAFQRANGLAVDGIAGKQTWTRLMA